MIMRLLQTLKRAWHRKRYERDLADELAFHLQCRVDALVRQGVAQAEALRRARLELGMVELHRDAVRAAHGLLWLDRWWGDLVRAARGLMASPVFVITSALVLGLAIGVNLILQGLWQNYLANPPATSVAGLLYDLELRGNQAQFVAPLTADEIQWLTRDLASANVSVIASRQSNQVLGLTPPRMTYGASVNAAYFPTLKHQILAGRSFVAADFASAAPVVVVGERLWNRLPPAERRLPGTLKLGGQTVQIIGVLTDGFAGLEPFPPQFFLTDRFESRLLQQQGNPIDSRFNTALLVPAGLSAETLRGRLLNWFQTLPRNAIADERVGDAHVLARRSQLSAAESRDADVMLAPLISLTLLLLIAACANVGNLMLARVSLRQQELAVRASLGASRWQLIRLLMLESLLLALLAGAFGMMLTSLALDPLHRYAMSMLVAMGIEPLPMHINWSLLPWMLLQALVACFGFGLLPALSLTSGDLAQAARRDGRLWQGRVPAARLRGWLMSTQVAISLVLLVLAAMIISLSHKSREIDIGYPTETLVDLRHPSPDAALRARLIALPGVRAVTSTANAPLYGVVPRQQVRVGDRSLALGTQTIAADYFQALSLPIVLGRNFTEAEASQQSPLAMISASTAAALWPGQSPLNQRITVIDTDADGLETAQSVTVIGVVPSVVSGLPLAGIDGTMLYRPGALGQPAMRDVLVRIDAGATDAMLNTLADACVAGPNPQICQPWRLSDMVSVYRLPLIVCSHLAAGLGFISLLISALGLFGVMRFQVRARWREFGIRIALGATPQTVLRQVLRQSLRQIRAGFVLGLVACLGVSLLLVKPIGWLQAFPLLAYVGVPTLLLLVALASAWWPARQAVRLSALEALRER
ncbi:hypothetical protein C7S18_21730 [Ahniella affigens]|uniref:ABC transporter permease n=1 Tax=Ahniella affigens TaxID=2021234 RepID=A0A2P1PXQ7_9GAMM|nr:ABC transporter permease [Ahniella affigens]AVP99633.1 hypothetical protein C7S18_21730 [Ahniella affigens]